MIEPVPITWYAWTDVKVQRSLGTVYLNHGHGRANRQNVEDITEFRCVCTTRPPLTESGSPTYRVTGLDDSQERRTMVMVCTGNGGVNYQPGVTECVFGEAPFDGE
jgi:hypothetical protein